MFCLQGSSVLTRSFADETIKIKASASNAAIVAATSKCGHRKHGVNSNEIVRGQLSLGEPTGPPSQKNRCLSSAPNDCSICILRASRQFIHFRASKRNENQPANDARKSRADLRHRRLRNWSSTTPIQISAQCRIAATNPTSTQPRRMLGTNESANGILWRLPPSR